MQEEIKDLKKLVDEFQRNYSNVEKESHARLKEATEAQMRALQLQETIERYLIFSQKKKERYLISYISMPKIVHLFSLYPLYVISDSK